MAATAATVVDFRRVNEAKIFKFSATTNIAGATEQFSISVPRRGILNGLKVVCPTSVDFDILLTAKLDAVLLGADSLVSIQDITDGIVSLNKESLSIPYFNNDTVMVDKLYLTIINTDAMNATGVISIEVNIGTEGGV